MKRYINKAVDKIKQIIIKQGRRRISLWYRFKILCACIVCAFGIFFVNAGQVNAASSVTLSPGQTYNADGVKSNTDVIIDKEGSYYLKGKSDSVFVYIKKGNVKLYLKDGLNLDPSVLLRSRSAITVEDQGGNVEIVSEKNAKIYLSSCLVAPAICKEGLNTKLIFSTEDVNNPGTIECVTGKASGCAGIGGIRHVTRGSVTGNMEFNSGNIIATAKGVDGAGIGAGGGEDCQDITINGGNITANGAPSGAGIGGGLKSYGKNITINNGTVIATGGDGASGIGGGGDSGEGGGDYCYGRNITINGGTVVAKGVYAGAGIGGGIKGNGDNIIINGGNVTAIGGIFGGAGIGGGGGNNNGGAGNVTINGGQINASSYGGGCAVGSGWNSNLNSVINITGGKLNAYANADDSKAGMAIGVSIDPIYSGGEGTINISGGTITAKGGDSDIGSKRTCNIKITGGSVKANNISGTLTGVDNKSVKKTVITMKSDNVITDNSLIKLATIKGISQSYGLKDVYGIDGSDGKNAKLYFWLPDSSSVNFATSNIKGKDVVFRGDVASGNSGDLEAVTHLVIMSDGQKVSEAYIDYLGNTLKNHTVPTKENYELIGYALDEAGHKMIINRGMDLIGGNINYVNYDHKWVYSSENDLVLYAVWHRSEYSVIFNKNKPVNTSGTVKGSMENQTIQTATSKALSSNNYSLDGYSFKGWNTKADGTGTSYSNEQEVNNLASSSSSITLYAQWQPLEYKVYFSAGEGNGTMDEQTLTYDKSENLSANTFSKSSSSFVGWSRGALGHIYEDKARVCNLCTLDGNGIPEGVNLTAQWADYGSVVLMITLNGKSIDIPNCETSIILNSNSSDFTGFKKSGNGTYQLNNLPSNAEYTLLIDDFDGINRKYDTSSVRITTKPDEAVIINLNYCTVQINSQDDDYYGTAWIEDGNSRVSKKTVLVGDKLIINSGTNEGYIFESYTAMLNAPKWEDDNLTIPNQEITVKGETIITSHPTPIKYKIKFNSNGGKTPSGEISKMQDLIYDEPSNLFDNKFIRKGYVFAGWSENNDGSGTVYDNGQSVKNLSNTNNDTLNLYAKWDNNNYYVHFSNNGALGTMDAQKFTYDKTQTLNSVTLSKAGYRFKEWNTKENGEGTSYKDKASVMNLTDEYDGNVILYAQWQRENYVLNYVSNDKKNASIKEKVLVNEEHKIAGNSFKRDGYKFVQWNTRADGKGEVYKVGDNICNLGQDNETITLYAQWKKIPSVNPDKKDSKKDGALVDTSDNANIPLMIMLLCISFTGIITIIYVKKHNS